MGRRPRNAESDRPGMSGDDNRGNPPHRAATHLVNAGRRAEWTSIPDRPGGVVSPAVWRASTTLYDDVAHLRSAIGDHHQRFFYGRKGTPTSWSLADALTALEPGAEGTMLFPSGVAAIAAALMAVLKPGDRLLMVDSAYDPTRNFCEGVLRPWGVDTVYYDPMIGADIASLIDGRTRAIFLESPGSLTFEVQDVPAIVAVARNAGIATLIDNSWATPLLFPAIAAGVDISILACTKYIVGHSDVMMGSATASARCWPDVQRMAHALGQMASPDDAWLTARGLRTLDVRLARHGENALKVARWLANRPEIAAVYHPALPQCRGHALWARDFSGASGLFSFAFSGGSGAARDAFVDALTLFGIGYSWGGFESLALPIEPQRYRTATRHETGGPMVRLHIGLEDAEDLIADIEQALKRWREAKT